MPSISAIVLVTLVVGAAPQQGPPSAERADYRAAFGDAADFAPPDAWPTLQEVDRQAAATHKPGRLPIEFRPATRMRGDDAVRQASGTEPAVSAQLAAGDRSIPLAPPQLSSTAASAGRMPTASVPAVLGSCGAVVGLFLIVAWILRRGMPKGSGLLPREVVEVLGRAPLAARQQVHLLRLGNKLILVSMTPAGIETLTEVTDPLEVDRLTGLCYQAHPHGATASFRQVFQSFEDPRASYPGARNIDRLDLTKLDAIALGQTGKDGNHAR